MTYLSELVRNINRIISGQKVVVISTDHFGTKTIAVVDKPNRS